MRKLNTTLLLLLALALLAACAPSAPRISPAVTELDLGDVPNGQIISRDITLRNDGEAPLIVDSLSTSCGCTTAALDAMQIAPGESAELHITFDSGAHGPDLVGPLLRHVYIDSNDPQQPETVIALSVNITPPAAGASEP